MPTRVMATSEVKRTDVHEEVSTITYTALMDYILDRPDSEEALNVGVEEFFDIRSLLRYMPRDIRADGQSPPKLFSDSIGVYLRVHGTKVRLDNRVKVRVIPLKPDTAASDMPNSPATAPGRDVFLVARGQEFIVQVVGPRPTIADPTGLIGSIQHRLKVLDNGDLQNDGKIKIDRYER